MFLSSVYYIYYISLLKVLIIIKVKVLYSYKEINYIFINLLSI